MLVTAFICLSIWKITCLSILACLSSFLNPYKCMQMIHYLISRTSWPVVDIKKERLGHQPFLVVGCVGYLSVLELGTLNSTYTVLRISYFVWRLGGCTPGDSSPISTVRSNRRSIVLMCTRRLKCTEKCTTYVRTLYITNLLATYNSNIRQKNIHDKN